MGFTHPCHTGRDRSECVVAIFGIRRWIGQRKFSGQKLKSAMHDKIGSLPRLSSATSPVFLADIDRSRGVLRLHVRRGVDVHAVHDRAQAFLAAQETPLRLVIEQHRRKDLTLPRSLDKWLDRLALQDVIHDPTLIVARARYLVSLAWGVRQALGRRCKGVFFDPVRRMLVVVVRPIGDREETAVLVKRSVDEVSRAVLPHDNQFGNICIRIASERPGFDLVPVDRHSDTVLGACRRIARQSLAPVVMALAALAAMGPSAASASPRQVLRAAEPAKFGVLEGLTLLSDGSYQSRLDAFASGALKMYFGLSAAGEKAMQLAQANLSQVQQQQQEQSESQSASPGS